VRTSPAGLTVPPGDAEALAAAVRQATTVPAADLRAMGRAGYDFYQETLSEDVNGRALAYLLTPCGSGWKDEPDVTAMIYCTHGPYHWVRPPRAPTVGLPAATRGAARHRPLGRSPPSQTPAHPTPSAIRRSAPFNDKPCCCWRASATSRLVQSRKFPLVTLSY
jgi:hypothetical protein